MKKLLLTFVVLLCSAAMFAGPLKKTSGDGKCFLENATAVLSMDLSNTTFDKKQRFQTWCGKDYEERVAVSEKGFTTSFNQYSKGLKIAEQGTDAKYKIVIDVKNFQRKSASFGFGRFHMKIYGTLSVIDNATGETVCAYTIDGLSGGDDFNETDRFEKSFFELGKVLLK